MNSLITLLLLYFFIYNCETANKTYTTKYDGVNLDEVLTSERLLNGYVSCLLGLGPCTADGKELKNNLPDAIANDCTKCTEKQREGSERVMHFIIDERPDDWDKLEKKYDSDGTYKMKYIQKKLQDSESKQDSNNTDEQKEK